MERRSLGRDLGLTLRMGIAIALLAILYTPLPIGFVLFVRGWSGSWLLAVAGLAAVVVFLCFLPALSERLALRAAKARVVGREDEPELYALVERLSAMADLPVPRVGVADTDVPNAFAAGRSPGDAVVVVTRGLRARLSPQELEAVLAHELAHVAHRDAFVMTLVSAPALLGHMLFAAIVAATRTPFPRKLGVFFVLLYGFFFLLFLWILYAVATSLVMTVSRHREYVADRGAVILTGAPEQLMSALQRLAADMPLIPQADLREVAGANALFILPAEPPPGDFEVDPERIFRSHPPLEQRFARLSDAAHVIGRPARADVPEFAYPAPQPATGNPRALLAFFCAALYWCFVGALWLGSGDPFQAAWPMALAWIGGVVLGIRGAGRASAGAPGMGFAVGALTLLVGPWVLVIAGVFVLFLLGSAGVVG